MYIIYYTFNSLLLGDIPNWVSDMIWVGNLQVYGNKFTDPYHILK